MPCSMGWLRSMRFDTGTPGRGGWVEKAAFPQWSRSRVAATASGCYSWYVRRTCTRSSAKPRHRTSSALEQSMPLVWVGLAILAIGVEAGLASLSLGPEVQLAAFALLALMLPVVLRRSLVRRFGGHGVPSRTDVLMGAIGEVTQAIDPIHGTGRVVVHGQDWAARSTEPLHAGIKVEVIAADGIVLIVQVRTET